MGNSGLLSFQNLHPYFFFTENERSYKIVRLQKIDFLIRLIKNHPLFQNNLKGTIWNFS